MASNVLVWAEQSNGAFSAGSLGVLAKGRELASALGGELVTVVVGSGVASAAAGLGANGAGRVLVADGERFAAPVAGPYVDALQAAVAAAQPQVVLLSASVLGAEIAGGLAARLGVGVTNDGTDVRAEKGEVVVVRPALEDTVLVDCGFPLTGPDGLRGIALFRSGSFAAASPNGGQATVETLTVADSGRPQITYTPHEQPETGGVDITEADVLIGAGRGLGGPEHFDIVEALAKAVGGEVATTRAVVDAGWYDYSTQVGQTGKTVNPKLYIALGISGAIQHKVGMQSSGTIVAINKDPNAPIFEFADFGVVGDLFDIVPKLDAALRARKG